VGRWLPGDEGLSRPEFSEELLALASRLRPCVEALVAAAGGTSQAQVEDSDDPLAPAVRRFLSESGYPDAKVRQNLNTFFVISIFVNIGMWYERFVIIVPSLAHSYEPWKFLNYHMSYTEAAILLGSFGWFFMWFLLFLRFLPGLSIAEIKEILPPPVKHHAAHKLAESERERVVEELPTGYKEYERRLSRIPWITT
jgi:hypothetical protein